MRKIICILLIVFILPIPQLLAQSEESAQTQESPQTKPKETTETPGPKTVVPPEENPFEEFITPDYTCMFCRVYAGTLLQDAKHVVIFPTYYDSKKWLRFFGKCI